MPSSLWPARRACNFAAFLDKHGMVPKPRYLHHWTRDTALNAMAAHAHMSRADFEQFHPIDFMALINRYGYSLRVGLGVPWPPLDRLLPRDVICAYRGPAINVDWLWEDEEMVCRLNLDTTERVNQALLRDAGLLLAWQ